jgi:hypothetical protein
MVKCNLCRSVIRIGSRESGSAPVHPTSCLSVACILNCLLAVEIRVTDSRGGVQRNCLLKFRKMQVDGIQNSIRRQNGVLCDV